MSTLVEIKKGLPSALRRMSTPVYGQSNTSAYLRGRIGANAAGRQASKQEGVSRNLMGQARALDDSRPLKLRRKASAAHEAAYSQKLGQVWDSNGSMVRSMNAGRDNAREARQAMRRMAPTQGGARMR